MTISFLCPNCGGHQLQEIRQAVHRAEVRVTSSPTGQLIATPVGAVEELRGPIMGYRCRKCRYPDRQNHDESGGFFWPTPEAVHAAGCLSITTEQSVPHRCMICHKDGSMEPLLIAAGHPGSLTAAERSKILSRRGLRGAVILCESDPGIAAFACTNWEGVDTVGLC